MKRFILNELKIKKATFITCTLLLVINPILAFMFSGKNGEVGYNGMQGIYTIFTFALMWECNTISSFSDVKSKVFITYKSLPISSKKFVLNKYAIYIMTSILYGVITFCLTRIVGFIDKDIPVMNFNSILLSVGTSLNFISIQMPIIFKNVEKYLSFIVIGFVILFAIVPRFLDKFIDIQFKDIVIKMIGQEVSNISILYFIVSIILIGISLNISMVTFQSRMRV